MGHRPSSEARTSLASHEFPVFPPVISYEAEIILQQRSACSSTVTTARYVHRLQTDEMASIYGGYLRTY